MSKKETETPNDPGAEHPEFFDLEAEQAHLEHEQDVAQFQANESQRTKRTIVKIGLVVVVLAAIAGLAIMAVKHGPTLADRFTKELQAKVAAAQAAEAKKWELRVIDASDCRSDQWRIEGNRVIFEGCARPIYGRVKTPTKPSTER